jgi:hypothetical protein
VGFHLSGLRDGDLCTLSHAYPENGPSDAASVNSYIAKGTGIGKEHQILNADSAPRSSEMNSLSQGTTL